MTAGRRAAAAGQLPDPDETRALAHEIRDLVGERVRLDEPMSRHTTMRVGGPADLLVAARDARALSALVRFARAHGLPFVVVGRGSDLVVSDRGVRGLVILCRAEASRIEGTRLIAEAGLPMARAALVSGRSGLAGLEFGVAIPGTVGGAIWANAGAHGSDVAAVLESATLLDAGGQETAVPASALALSYRSSRLKQRDGATAGSAHVDAMAAEVVLDATFALDRAAPAAITERLAQIRRWRRDQQPLELPSAGSVFRNPAGDSAGRMIEACGLKGTRRGGAAISQKHANFIVNLGGAAAADVRHLAELARSVVQERLGEKLELEIQYAGDWRGWEEKEP
jgi:UDP-N-acetylmuramate dehydrogenase